MKLSRATLHRATALALVIVIVAHRAYLWHLFGEHLDSTALRNPGWLTWQYLSLDSSRNYFWKSLYYLQQEPPIPQFVFNLALQIFEWPVGVARGFYVLQTLISIATVLAMFAIMVRLGCPRIMAALLAGFFGISADLYLIEINSLGQLFYETGGMLLATLSSLLILRALNGENSAIWPGLTVALVALTRASFSYLSLPIALFLAWSKGWRTAALFMLPVILLQGAWTAKNYVAYGYVDVATSSWKGLNALIGYWFVPGAFDAFERYVLSNRDRYPTWFVKMTEEHGPVTWHPHYSSTYAPEEIQRREAQVQAALGGTNRKENSISLRLLTDVYMSAVPAFAITHPSLTLQKIWKGYQSFWQPIEDYSSQYLGPVYVFPRGRDLLAPLAKPPGRTIRLTTGSMDEPRQYRASVLGSLPPPTPSLYHLDTACFLIVHTLLPIFLALFLWHAARRSTSVDELRIAGAALPLLYGIVLFNLVEVGENLRYRLAVEPLIIAACASLCVYLCREALTFLASEPLISPVVRPERQARPQSRQ